MRPFWLAALLVRGRFSPRPFRSAAVLDRGRFSPRPLQPAAVSVRGRIGLRPFQSAAVLIVHQPIQALIDTGSDVTIAGANMAKKYKWKVRPTELKSVKAANGKNMMIEGVVNEIFAVGKRNIRVDVYITSDLNDLILGVDWLGKQGRLVWDFDTQRIRIGDGEWLTLQHENETSCRRIYVESEVVLPPKKESIVLVRVERNGRWAWPYEAVTESTKAPNLSRVYSSRTVLPARFSQLNVRVVNADERTQVLKKGTG